MKNAISFDENTLMVMNDLGFVDGLSDLEEQITSTTGMKLREQLEDNPKFSHFDEKDWQQFGRYAKKNFSTMSVFTGAIAALINWLTKGRGYSFPATEDYCRYRRLRSERYRTDMLLDILKTDGFLEDERIRAKEAKKVFMTSGEKKEAKKSHGNVRFTVWFPSDELEYMWDFLRRKKVRGLPSLA